MSIFVPYNNPCWINQKALDPSTLHPTSCSNLHPTSTSYIRKAPQAEEKDMALFHTSGHQTHATACSWNPFPITVHSSTLAMLNITITTITTIQAKHLPSKELWFHTYKHMYSEAHHSYPTWRWTAERSLSPKAGASSSRGGGESCKSL